MKDLLIICYTFPPAPGIGGRRWAKFSKYLCAEGFHVHVICAENPFDEISPYTNDIKHPNLNTYPLPLKYPRVLMTGPKNFFDKVRYKFYESILKRIVKGNQFDKGIFWKKTLLKKSNELIKKQNIKNVIVTGAPFSILHHAIELKKIHPDINLMADIRDPWTWPGCYRMSDERLVFEIVKEKAVIENYDSVFVPVLPMLDYLQTTYSSFKNKIKLLPHAFDPDEAPAPKEKKNLKSEGNTLKLLFYGTMYDNAEPDLNFLCDFLDKNPGVTVDFYTQTDLYKGLFEKRGLLKNRVQFFTPVLPALLMEKVRESDFVLMIHPLNEGSQGISTKFYEIIHQKVPILFIGYDKKIEELLHTNNIGISTNHTKTFNADTLKNFRYNYDYDVESYSFQSVTRNNLMNNLK